MIVDTEASMHFLRTAYEPDDWIAVFLKSYETGQTLQRVGPLSLFLEPKVHAWLRAMNAKRFNVYVSVNAVREGQRTRTKDAIAAVRHIFLEADEDGPERLADDLGARGPAAAVVHPGVLAGSAALLLARQPASRQKAPSGCRSTWRASSERIRRRRPARRPLGSPDTRTTSGRRRT